MEKVLSVGSKLISFAICTNTHTTPIPTIPFSFSFIFSFILSFPSFFEIGRFTDCKVDGAMDPVSRRCAWRFAS